MQAAGGGGGRIRFDVPCTSLDAWFRNTTLTRGGVALTTAFSAQVAAATGNTGAPGADGTVTYMGRDGFRLTAAASLDASASSVCTACAAGTTAPAATSLAVQCQTCPAGSYCAAGQPRAQVRPAAVGARGGEGSRFSHLSIPIGEYDGHDPCALHHTAFVFESCISDMACPDFNESTAKLVSLDPTSTYSYTDSRLASASTRSSVCSARPVSTARRARRFPIATIVRRHTIARPARLRREQHAWAGAICQKKIS